MGCDSDVVARSDLGCVTVCGCGCGAVTVHYGNAAMRIPVSDFTAFACMIDAAFAQIAVREMNGQLKGGKSEL